MISQHPGEELLLDYVSGALPEAASLAVACHISLCPACRAEAGHIEAVGGAAIAQITPQEIGADALAETLARLDQADAEPAPVGDKVPPGTQADELLPYPLRRYLPDSLDALAWRKRRNIVDTAALDIAPAGFITRLMRIHPGMAVPDHSHRGNEFTLVLEGGYTDGAIHFERGDFQAADSSVDHRPVADDEGCLCFVVLDAPMRLTGRIGRLVDPFVRL
jgi:putative transcriptional regulator